MDGGVRQHGWGEGGGGLDVNMGGWGGSGHQHGWMGVGVNMMGGVGWMSGSEGGWV